MIEAEPHGESEAAGELERLRARVAALEAELADRSERANAALAAAQDRIYWLERLHLDLNSLMARPAAARAMRLLPVARTGVRVLRRAQALARTLPDRRRGARQEAAEEAARVRDLAAQGVAGRAGRQGP